MNKQRRQKTKNFNASHPELEPGWEWVGNIYKTEVRTVHMSFKIGSTAYTHDGKYLYDMLPVFRKKEGQELAREEGRDLLKSVPPSHYTKVAMGSNDIADTKNFNVNHPELEPGWEWITNIYRYEKESVNQGVYRWAENTIHKTEANTFRLGSRAYSRDGKYLYEMLPVFGKINLSDS